MARGNRPHPETTLHTSHGRPLATQVVARPTHVDLPPAALAIMPTYPTLADAELRFLTSIRFRSPRTAATYRDGMLRFDHFLTQAGVDPFTMTADDAQIPEDVLEHFFRWLHESGYSRGAVQTYLGGAKAFWKFATAKHLVPGRFSYDAMRDGLYRVTGKHIYRSPRIDPRLPLVLTHVDGLALPEWSERGGVRRLELLRDRALLHVLFYSGMRRAEVGSLNRQDVQDGWAHDSLVIGKGDKERNVFFGEDAQRAIRAYLEARSDDLVPLFLRHDNRRGRPGPGGEHWRLSLQSVWGIVKDYARAVGVSASTHHFRHLKASTLLNRGASLSEVQDVLGHATPDMTKLIYAHYTPKFLRAAVEKYSATTGRARRRARGRATAPPWVNFERQ